MRRLVGAAVLLAAGVAVHLTTPTEEDLTAPILVRADLGDWGQGRSYGAQVDEVALATQVTDGDWVGATEGVWVVATVTAEAAGEPGTVGGSLFLDDLRFDVSDRAGVTALNGVTLSPGFPQQGVLLFEVPARALSQFGDDARLQVTPRLDPRLDSAVEVPVDLADLAVTDLLELTPAGPGER